MDNRPKETICWNCKRIYRELEECSWLKDFTPVKEWNATPTKNGCLVHECPMFILNEEIEVSIRQIIKITGIPERTFFRILKTRRNPITYINQRYLKGKNFFIKQYKDEEEEVYSIKFTGEKT